MRWLLTISAFHISTFLFAQQQVFSYDPPYVDNLYSNIIVEEHTNSFYLVGVDKDYIERIYITPSGTVNLLHQGISKNEKFKINQQIEWKMHALFFKNKYLCGYVSGTKMIDALQHRHFNEVFIVETNLSTGTSVCTDTIKVLWKDDMMFHYIRNNQLVLVEKPKGKSYLLFHSKAFGEKLRTDTMKIDLPVIGKASNALLGGNINIFGDISLENNMQLLPNNLWLPVYALNFRNKTFVQKDKFYITINANDLTTWVISVDLNGMSYEIKKYDSDLSNQKLKGSVSNAALVVDSFLITGIANNKKIYYSVYDINSGHLLHSQTITEENLNDISTSPIMKVGDFWSRSNLSEVKLDEFVSKASENQLIINGYREKNELYLTFGSMYKRLLTATFVGNIVTLGMGGFTQVKPPSTVYFHTALQTGSFNVLKKPVRNFVWDKMLNHVFANRGNSIMLNLFYMNGFYYIGYFSMPKREYQLYRFNEKMSDGN